jgi:hypothetical protein
MLLVMGAAILGPRVAFAHGALSMDGDTCVMKVGPYKIHFTGYAPETKPSQEFCEDIPDSGKAIIAFDQIDKALRRMSMEMRILRDDRRLGANAQYEQLGGEKEIETSTLVHRAPEVYGRGNLTVELDLAKGNYIGLVKMTDPETKQQFVSMFPFAVGYGAGRQSAIWFIEGLLALIGVGGAVYFIVLRPGRSSGPSMVKTA